MARIDKALRKVFYEIGVKPSGGPPTVAFVENLQAEGFIEEQLLIDSVSMKPTPQGKGKGDQRIIGVYIPSGENLYDADFDGTSRVAIVVDFLLKNSDVMMYARYADALMGFLNRIDVGHMHKVINISFSHADGESNERIAALLAIEFEPETDGGIESVTFI
nr:hypothetical protein [uncultured Sphaerochaeta sp.]